MSSSDNFFEKGNFSAKYIKSGKSEEIPESSIPATDASNCNPITIEGSFKNTSHSSPQEIGFSVNHQRKESLLSSSISRSLVQSRIGSYAPETAGFSNLRKPQISSNMPQGNNEVDVDTIEKLLPGDEEVKEENTSEPAGTNYSAMKLPGGFLTRDIENWVQDQKQPSIRRVASDGSIVISSKSRATFSADDGLNARELTLPGGFRRNFYAHIKQNNSTRGIVTKNFFEFLSLYGHFAGEDLREEEGEDELITETEYETEAESEYEEMDEEAMGDEEGEDEEVSYPKILRAMPVDQRGRARMSFNSVTGPFTSPKVTPYITNRNKKRLRIKRKVPKERKGASTTKAFLLLLKAFLGTGVIFLPKGFSNGGLLFCNIMIVMFSLISYYCFIILIKTTKQSGVFGYGDAGLKVFGRVTQTIILLSLVLSQMGFASSYVVFVSANFTELTSLIWENSNYTIGFFILLQLVLFLPLSLTRKISKLGFTALIADVFIFFGLVYIYYESSSHLISSGVSPKISMFKSDTWSLFIGTAVFAYEGIGLLIPIQESMAEPEKFDKLLLSVMVIVTIVFTSLASISYLSFGDDVNTVILMNFPSNSVTLTVQLCYAIAILLSTPLQIFPAIKIIENYLFHKSRKTWKDRIRRNSEALSLLSNEQLAYDSIENPLSAVFSNASQHSPNPHLINQEGLLSGKSDTFIKTLKNILRILMIFIMAAIGYLGSNKLDKFVALVGSFTCIPLIYIYPPILYLGCFGPSDDIRLGEKFLCWIILAMGVGLMAYTSIDTIINW